MRILRFFMGRLGGLLIGWLLLALGATAQSGYLTYDQLTAELQRLDRSHSQWTNLHDLGTTREGRTIWALEIGTTTGAPRAERPALLIVGNLSADHLVGSEVALRMAQYLLDNAESDDAVRDAVGSYTFYIIPRLNPDGAEMMFQALKTGTRTNTRPFDDDNDGRTDEDGPEDLNGDGRITVMRVADPQGAYMLDPNEARLLKRATASKGESGTYAVYIEGLDNDGDGFYNEDAPGGVDLDRNFQHEYPYYKRGAGPHMVSESESRALMDFVIAHRNIAAILTFGHSDNLLHPPNAKGEWAAVKGLDLYNFAQASIARANAVGTFRVQQNFGGFFFGQQQNQNQGQRPQGRRPATTVDRRDLTYFTTVSAEYKKLTGLNTPPPLRKPEGAFAGYGYYQFGVPTFTTPGWGLPAPANAQGGQGRSTRGGMSAQGGGFSDGAFLAWMDSTQAEGFAAWTPYDHPSLGAVEIGGFDPYAAVNPPASMLDALGENHAKFAVYLTSIFANVQIAETEVTDHGGGIFRIKAEIENTGFLPTAMGQGVRARSVKPTMVQLDLPPEQVISGAAKTSFFQALDGSGKRQTYEWIIQGERGAQITLRVVAQKGGTTTRTITLQ